jgi:hypothetical protein
MSLIELSFLELLLRTIFGTSSSDHSFPLPLFPDMTHATDASYTEDQWILTTQFRCTNILKETPSLPFPKQTKPRQPKAA